MAIESTTTTSGEEPLQSHHHLRQSPSGGTVAEDVGIPAHSTPATNLEVDLTDFSAVAVVPDDSFTVGQAVNALGFGKFQIALSLVVGVCWMADSMEVMTLSILGPALHCEWGVRQHQQAVLTTAAFSGMMLTSGFWARFSDVHGRRKALVLSSFFLSFHGLLSAFATSYGWVVFLRFLVGLSIGCLPQSVTLLAEFLPTRQRARCVVLLDCFWALGACLQAILATLVMPPPGGWRWLLALTSLPPLMFVGLASAWLPESARLQVSEGRTSAAMATLRRVAQDNGKPMPPGRLIVDDDDHHRARFKVKGGFSDLLARDFRRTTLLLWSVWTGCSFTYYGIVLMTTELFETTSGGGDRGFCSSADPTVLRTTCSAQCRELDRVDYTHQLWTAAAEFPGIVATVLAMEALGRKVTLALELLLLAVCLSLLFHCSGSDRIYLTAVLFFARGIASGALQAAYMYTPEVYPTSLRSVGIGACAGAARLGAMLTPYVAQVLVKVSLTTTVSIYLTVCLLASFASLLLPLETKDRDLGEADPGRRSRLT